MVRAEKRVRAGRHCDACREAGSGFAAECHAELVLKIAQSNGATPEQAGHVRNALCKRQTRAVAVDTVGPPGGNDDHHRSALPGQIMQLPLIRAVNAVRLAVAARALCRSQSWDGFNPHVVGCRRHPRHLQRARDKGQQGIGRQSLSTMDVNPCVSLILPPGTSPNHEKCGRTRFRSALTRPPPFRCEFRRKADGGSNARRTLIPTEAGQWFQSIPDSPEAGLAVEVGNPMTGSVAPLTRGARCQPRDCRCEKFERFFA